MGQPHSLHHYSMGFDTVDSGKVMNLSDILLSR